jgi:hypothetical protein
VVTILRDRNRYATVHQPALASAQRYALDNMVNQFTGDIEHCLSMPGK